MIQKAKFRSVWAPTNYRLIFENQDCCVLKFAVWYPQKQQSACKATTPNVEFLEQRNLTPPLISFPCYPRDHTQSSSKRNTLNAHPCHVNPAKLTRDPGFSCASIHLLVGHSVLTDPGPALSVFQQWSHSFPDGFSIGKDYSTYMRWMGTVRGFILHKIHFIIGFCILTVPQLTRN